MIHIALAGSRDVDAITSLARATFAIYVERMGREPAPMTANYAELLADPAGEVVVARAGPHPGSPLLGFAAMVVKGPAHAASIWLETIAVTPSVRGSGLGRRLLVLCQARARRRGFTHLKLYTNAAMHETFAFYASAGYQETGRRSEDGFARVFFARAV